MPFRFSRSADKHGVPRRSSAYVAITGKPESISTNWGEAGTLFVGTDDRGIELEVITVSRGLNEEIVHAMPTEYRFKG